jgi:TolB-like protein/class 3 adenylate cyclase/rhodanese-related sulfurtransferase
VPRNLLSGKLVVILHADVADSTELVQQDKRIAHERIRDSFRHFSGIIENYRGQVLELRGDALLAAFERASDAVTAALAFQVDQASRDDRPTDDGLWPRIRAGIAIGEVIIADNTVTGAGVVQAQRIEQLANPGGVCITAAIHEALSKRLPFEFETLGDQALHGFGHPVHVYRVASRPGETIPPPEAKRGNSHTPWRPAAVVAGCALLLAIGAAYWIGSMTLYDEVASPERMAFPLPDKPSIAILPFTNMSNDVEQDFFADGMTDDLITDVSKISGLFVIARNSVFTYKNKPVVIKQVAEDLGVRYVMEGSVQRAGRRIRINAQLIDATTGGHVWADRYDGTLDDVFAMRDKITESIVAALSVNLLENERSGGNPAETSLAEAYDAFLRGWSYYRLSTPDDSVKAVRYLRNAVELDPDFGRAHAALAATYWRVYDNNWAEKVGVSYAEALELTNRHLAKAMKNPTPLAYRTAAKKKFYFRQPDEAVALAEKAIALDPNDPNGYEAMGSILVNFGRAGEGLELIEKAIRLDPQSNYLYQLGEAQFHLEHYDESAATMARATKRNPDDEWNYFLLAAAYGQSGREREARAAIAKFNRDYHDPTDREHALTLADLDTWIFNQPANRKRLQAGLRKAGVPEGEPPAPAESRYKELVTAEAEGFEVRGATRIDVDEAKTLYDRGVIFIDSSGSSLYRREHIPRAVNLLFHQVWNGLAGIAAPDDEVVFYCDDPKCHLAAISSAQAVVLGYSRVYYFAGGLRAWEIAGYPVEKS